MTSMVTWLKERHDWQAQIGCIGKVRFFAIRVSQLPREERYYLSSTRFTTQRLYAKSIALLKQAAEDRAAQLLKDMGVVKA